MKKYLIPMIALGLVATGIFVRYQIVAPARAAAAELVAINGLTVGKTTEAELLARSAFQTAAQKCFGPVCVYYMETENFLLNRLHLAPRSFFSAAVQVREGMVTDVSVLLSRDGLLPVTIKQVMKMPEGCRASPCIRKIPPAYAWLSTQIIFDNESAIRNRMPSTIDAGCFSRLRGCSTYSELMPLAKELNLEAMAR
jgi:hypothetical protein